MENQHLNYAKIILIICIALSLYLLVPKCQNAYKSYNELQTKIKQVADLRSKIDNLNQKKIEHEKQQQVSTKPVYKNDVEVTDRMSSFGVMFEDVIQSAKYNGLKLRTISYDENPAGDRVATSLASDYNVCAISMQLIGSYMQFRSYFQDIYNYPYVINLDKVSIKPYERNKSILVADVVVTLYSNKTESQKAAYKAEQEAAEALTAGDQKASDSGVQSDSSNEG